MQDGRAEGSTSNSSGGMEGWSDGWREGWRDGWRNVWAPVEGMGLYRAIRNRDPQVGEAKNGQLCFNLAVCKLMACPCKAERLQILIWVGDRSPDMGRRQ